jgi:hypothetical protein
VIHCAHGQVNVATQTPPTVGTPVFVVVQADKMTSAPTGLARENRVDATLRGREYAGSHNIYLMDLIDGTEVKLTSQATLPIEINTPVSAYFAAEHATLIEGAA